MSEEGKKKEVRTFLPRNIVEEIDHCVEEGELGNSRSEVIRTILRDWKRGVLK